MFATWWMVEELGLLFDAGDGAQAGLLSKARKIKHVFLSHAHRDHLTGLPQLVQLNASTGSLVLHYPKDSGSFPAMAEFLAQFDPHVEAVQWLPFDQGEHIAVGKDLEVEIIRNNHVVSEQAPIKSVSFKVHRSKRKLRPEFIGMSGAEIGRLRARDGEDAITTATRETILGYSGDTPVEVPGRWNDTQVLIHEATFLTREEITPDAPHRGKHSSLDALMEMVAESNVQQLILGHFSTRYSAEQIDAAIATEAKRTGLRIPIFRVLPGQVSRNILAGAPVVHLGS